MMSFWKGFEKKALDGYDAKKCQEHAQGIMTEKLEPQLKQMEAQTAAAEKEATPPTEPKAKSEVSEKPKERKVVTEKFAASALAKRMAKLRFPGRTPKQISAEGFKKAKIKPGEKNVKFEALKKVKDSPAWNKYIYNIQDKKKLFKPKVD